MRTLILTLLFTLNLVANTNTDPKKDLTKGIKGLEIFSYNTKKLGKHIYVVSEMYTEKKVEFINENGLIVLSQNTIGDPITLQNLKPGIYKIKVTEEDKTDTLLYELN